MEADRLYINKLNWKATNLLKKLFVKKKKKKNQ